MSEQVPTQVVPQESQPRDPGRVRAFANFFRRYMSLSSLVVAALPIPLTALRLIPTYHAQTAYLTTYATLLCFLMLGFIFSIRHSIARHFFPQVVRRGFLLRAHAERESSPAVYASSGMDPGDVLLQEVLAAERREREAEEYEEWLRPRYRTEIRFSLTSISALLVFLTVLSIVLYHRSLSASIVMAAPRIAPSGNTSPSRPLDEPATERSVVEGTPTPSMIVDESTSSMIADASSVESVVLAETPNYLIPLGTNLVIFYLGMFVFAEAAFIIMAIKEYLQELVGLGDIELITGEEKARAVGPVDVSDGAPSKPVDAVAVSVRARTV